MGSKMNELRKKGKYCDVTINVDGRQFTCHKAVLVSNSDYFEGMFECDFIESKNDIINVHQVDANSFELLLDFLYTGTLEDDMDVIMDVLKLAKYMLVKNLIEYCMKYFSRVLNTDTAFKILLYAVEHEWAQLEEETMSYIVDNFSELMDSDIREKIKWFPILPYDLVRDIIGSKNLSVNNETDVFYAITRWVEYDKKERYQYVIELMKLVHFEHIKSKCFIGRMLDHDFVRDSSTLKDMIEEKTSPFFPKVAVSLDTNRTRSNIYMLGKEKRYSFPPDGKWGVQVTCYNGKQVYEHDMMRRHIAVSRIQAMVLDNRITTLIYNSDPEHNLFSYYDQRRDSWMEMAPPPNHILTVYNMVCTDNNDVYINQCGRDSDHFVDLLSNIYMYKPGNNTWYNIPITPNCSTASCIATDGRYIYSCGGEDGDGHYVAESYLYDPRVGEWSSVPSMHNRTSHAAGTFFNGKLYISGGWTDSGAISTIEFYDPIANRWEQGPLAPKPRDAHCLVPFKNKLYSIGGEVSQMHIYDPYLQKWSDGPNVSVYQNNLFVSAVL